MGNTFRVGVRKKPQGKYPQRFGHRNVENAFLMESFKIDKESFQIQKSLGKNNNVRAFVFFCDVIVSDVWGSG